MQAEVPRERNELVQRWPASQGKDSMGLLAQEDPLSVAHSLDALLAQLWGLSLQAHQTQIKSRLASRV